MEQGDGSHVSTGTGEPSPCSNITKDLENLYDINST